MSLILIIEDEKDIAAAIEYNLKKEGFRIAKAADGKAGLKLVRQRKPDLILLDLMLPTIDGLSVCKQLKADKTTTNIPIIMLTAKGEEVDKVVGLELGADDYLAKPFGMRELIARIKTVLKRVQPASLTTDSLKFPGLEINLEQHKVIVAGKEVELTAKEFALLHYLTLNQGRVINREKLLDEVWGIEVAIETRTVDVHIKKLREKLGKKVGNYLITLRGVGYKFYAQDS